jgi:hypothetical protein
MSLSANGSLSQPMDMLLREVPRNLTVMKMDSSISSLERDGYADLRTGKRWDTHHHTDEELDVSFQEARRTTKKTTSRSRIRARSGAVEGDTQHARCSPTFSIR